MSEYQYYEFLAIDRSLTHQEMDGLRALSSRAHITPVSFSNEYNWGDLKGDPLAWMKRFFDLHLYVANWGSVVFMMRLPMKVFDAKVFHAFTVDGAFEVEATPTHRVLVWAASDSEDYDRFVHKDREGWMARLAPLREELLRGDLRSLYLGWLAAVSMELVDAEEVEPMALDGLGTFTAAQQALAEFLEVDIDLLEGVGLGGRDLPPQEVDDWLAGLPSAEANVLLRQLLSGEGAQAERVLKTRFSAWRRSLQGLPAAPRRSVHILWQEAEKAKALRLRRENEERKQGEISRWKEREEYLSALAKNFPRTWKTVQGCSERGSGLGYDEACRHLIDLREAYSLHSSPTVFQKEFQRFMTEHRRRRALVERLVQAGLWQGI